MAKSAVTVENLSKKFGLSLRAGLKYGLIDSCRRLLGRGSDHRLRDGEFWALDNISFSLAPGDALGIMGVNGSGKTTLLRVLNGTYAPDAGKVTLRGRVGALIAAGAGFSPMLSGRENIHISGTLLGMTPAEVRRKFDEIVAFAELGDFLDMPVRNYSSGMAVRLGFAIAVIGTPEILLVDEVLAVGDLSFQKKCFERIQHLRHQGTTILLVSHAPSAIWSVCDKGLAIHRGITRGILSVEDACKEYETYNALARQQVQAAEAAARLPTTYGGARGGTGTALISQVQVLDSTGAPVSGLDYGEDFILRYRLDVRQRIDKGLLRILIDSEINKAISIIDNYEIHKKFIAMDVGSHVLDIRVRNPNLRPGVYTFGAAIISKEIGVHIFFEHNHASLVVRQPKDMFFYADYRSSLQLDANYTNACWFEDAAEPSALAS
jgi:lipopolysaccharide transport system ATP-binding protein